MAGWENAEKVMPIVPQSGALELPLQTSAASFGATAQRVALISLRFKPAFVSLFVALAKACLSVGVEVGFVLDPTYTSFQKFAALGPVSTYDQFEVPHAYTHAIFLNVSSRNLKLASSLKASGAKLIYVYHEPWTSALDRFQTEGVRGGVSAYLAHLLSSRLLKLADTIVIPSQHGARIYEQSDLRYNRNYVSIPLLFDDEADLASRTANKKYFSYIGAICRGHGFNEFVDFVRYSFQKGLPLQFLIASANLLPTPVRNDPLLREHRDQLVTFTGRPLQNEEINCCYAQSFCVWNLYHRSTQSAVLPKAFMFGAPVLATPLGAFLEFVKDGSNGKFITSPGDKIAIAAAIQEIQGNLSQYSANARRDFLENFHYKSHLPHLRLLLHGS